MGIHPADILFAYRWSAETIERLVSDIANDQFSVQPVKAINHPAWLLGHVSIYNDIIAALLRDDPFDDPWEQPCGKNSHPVADRSSYPSKDEIITRFSSGVAFACEAIESAPVEVWSAPLKHPTWGKQFETISPAVTFLATTHLALHVGQLSGWRRAMQLPRI